MSPICIGRPSKLQVIAAEQFHGIADRRIFTHAAVKAEGAVRRKADLAHQIDVSHRVAALRRSTSGCRGDLADHADRGALGMLECDELADRGAWATRGWPLHQRDMGFRTAA
jgi:hypothetical protein